MASAEIKTEVNEKYLIVFCDSCDEDGQTKTARSFCFDCEKYICSGCEKWHARFSRNHKTIAGDDLPEAKELDPLMQCASHAKHSAEFYCKKHQSVFCRLCRHIKHGDCEVKDFGTACQEFDLETEFNGAVDNLNNAIGHITEAKHRVLKQYERLEEEAAQRKTFIRNFRRDLDGLFDRYETKGYEHDQANMERTIAGLRSVEEYLKQIEDQMCLLEETKGHLGEDFIFLSVIKLNQLCKEYIGKAEDIVADAKEHKPFTFRDENITALLENFSIISCAEQPENTSSDDAEQGEATSDMRKKSFWNIKACTPINDTLVTTVGVKRANISACCTLANGEVVLCVSTNKKMMLVNKSLKLLTDINFQSMPFDVAEVDENTVAVTIPDEEIVQFITVNPGLKHENQIAVGRKCYGIAMLEKELYINTRHYIAKMERMERILFEHKYIEIWSTVTQQLLKSLEIVTDATPFYISPDLGGSNMFLSGGNGKEPIVCISKEGHVIYKYFDDTVVSPRNLFVDDEDNLLVYYVGTSAEKRTGLRVIKSGGQCGKDLLLQEENLGKITALHFDKRSDILLIASEDNNEGKATSKLRMFKLEYQ